MREHQMSIRNLNTEHGSGKYADDLTLGYNCGFYWMARRMAGNELRFL